MADRLNQNIQKFTAEGQFLTVMSPKGNGYPTDTAGLTIGKGMLCVADCSNHCIQVLNSDLSVSNTFNWKARQWFIGPWGIA